MVAGIESDFDLMSDRFGSYGEMNNGWTGEDVRGFSKIFGNQTSMYEQLRNKEWAGVNWKAKIILLIGLLVDKITALWM